ncbi:MAG: FAD-dependent oxidoreductase, partial [Chloroflexota bacterium]
MTHIVVIGSGFGGLASALRLQARGYQVTLLEQREQPGGRAYQLVDGGFTFDMGPSIITAPDLLDDLFGAAGVPVSQYVTLVPLEPYYRIYFGDGRHYDYSGDPATINRELTRFEASGPQAYQQFMERTGDIYRRAFADLAHQPFL